jgi:hypothetical protein
MIAKNYTADDEPAIYTQVLLRCKRIQTILYKQYCQKVRFNAKQGFDALSHLGLWDGKNRINRLALFQK